MMAVLVFSSSIGSIAAQSDPSPTVIRIVSSEVAVVSCQGQTAEIRKGGRLGDWTLMAIIPSRPGKRLAVLEDFSRLEGRLILVGEGVEGVELPKSVEPTWAEPANLYRGHSLKEVFDSQSDLLAEEILTGVGDPKYAEVAACFPPISKMHTYTFVGTPECPEKVGIFYGGGTPNFDPAAYVPEISKIRSAGRALDGLVGGWLPVIRFVYPESSGDWSELLIYAPMRVENGNSRVQPVWYRVSRIEGNTLRWVRYFDSYHPFPPRLEAAAEPFYEQLLAMRAGWNKALSPGMTVDIPDQRLSNLARHSLVREMMSSRFTAMNSYNIRPPAAAMSHAPGTSSTSATAVRS
jgi:hypothetical protein